MELAARSIDLVTALTNVTNNPDSRVWMEIGRWLGRERVDKGELQLCLGMAKGLVYANELCDSFYDEVTASRPLKVVAKRFVVSGTSGSLGQLMAGDPHLRWLTSTVAGLFQFYEQEYIQEAVLVFLLQSRRQPSAGGSEGLRKLSKSDIKYDPNGLTVKPVLDKLIDSVWFYVVNSDTAKSGIAGMLPLPDDIMSKTCPRGHDLTPYELATCLAQIREPSYKEIIIESEYFVQTLVWWSWYHFTGSLRVVVSGVIVAERVADDEGDSRKIEIRIGRRCSREGPCDYSSPKSQAGTLKVYATVGSSLQCLMEATPYVNTTDDPFGIQKSWARPRVRGELYDVYPKQGPHNMTINRQSMELMCCSVAAQLVSWIIRIPVLGTIDAGPDLTYTVDPAGNTRNAEEPRRLRLMDLLARSPSILHRGWDNIQTILANTVIFANPNSTLARFDWESATDIDVVLRHLPILQDMVQAWKRTCPCIECMEERQSNTPPSRYALSRDPNCLQQYAVTKTLQIVAHAIADGFGCDDAAGLTGRDRDMGVASLLSAVCLGKARWNDWFRVASRVFLGCDALVSVKSEYGRNETEEPLLAVQYGGIATLAPWLDISADLRRVKPFSMELVKGCIGVVRGDGGSVSGSEVDALQSVEGRFALIYAQETGFVESQADRLLSATQFTPECRAPRDTTTALGVDMILVPDGSARYRLWVRVTTKGHSRMIDPSSTIRALPKLVENKTWCSHPIDDTAAMARDGLDRVDQAYSFDHVLGLWGPGLTNKRKGPQGARPTIALLSPLCDSHLRFNVAVALTEKSPRIMSSGEACLECRFKENDAAKMMKETTPDGQIVMLAKDYGYVVRVCDEILHSEAGTWAINWRGGDTA